MKSQGDWKTRAIPVVGGAVVTTLMRTTRTTTICGLDSERRFIYGPEAALFVLWHGRLLTGAWRYHHCGLGTLISRNRDGDYITRMIENWGYQVVRGSSSRGGAGAVRDIVEVLRGGTSVAVTPDGPRGPRQVMKIGPVKTAQAAGVPMVPVSAGASRGRFFGSWDRFQVPAPFARCYVAMGEPIDVPADADEPELERLRLLAEHEVNRLTEVADRRGRSEA